MQSIFRNEDYQKGDVVTESTLQKKKNFIEQTERIQAVRESIADDRIRRNQIEVKVESVYEEAKVLAFKYMVAKIYKESLVIDDYFVQEHASDYDNFVYNYINENGGLYMLINNPNKNNNLLNGMIKIIEHYAIYKANDVRYQLENSNMEMDEVDLSITDEEKKELDTDLSNLSVDEISELVKKKVTRVVLDEKKAALKQEEVVKAAEEELAGMIEDGADPEEAKQNMSTSADEKTEVEMSLFKSLMQKTYKEYLKENSSTKDVKEDDKEIEFKDDEEDDNKETQEEVMEKVMAEAISEYTIYELMHTMQLQRFNREDIQRMAYENAYVK